jgi:hypothetical protein
MSLTNKIMCQLSEKEKKSIKDEHTNLGQLLGG